MIKKMEQENIFGRMEMFKKGFGKMVSFLKVK